MPGILPMKLIKCGNSQTRIAQACDRCRSKKIRCDGIRPCCTQCANVGFECKTSDKLSRRAFPRGYTESLEERVRSLESEVRELKDLLDQKEEQMEMLSRIHSFSPYSPPPSNGSGMPVKKQRDELPSVPKEECFSMVESYGLMGQTNQNGFFMGPSSGRPFLDVFKQKLLDTNRFSTNFSTDSFLMSPATISISSLSLDSGSRSSHTLSPPPRLESDHFLVSYFQEYHPLFPVVHRPAFLRFYEKLLKSVENGNPGAGLSKHAIAQLFLIFSIMAEHSDGHDSHDQATYDVQWQRALNDIILESTLETLQCLVLAQIYCCVRGDYSKLLQYKSLSAGICFRLGLNQSQKKFTLTPLVSEMRKRVFWCAATLDSFSAAMLGQPRLLRSDTIDCELPSDVDDEYVSEKGFLPTIPGDSTKISSALALFRCSSILGKILEKVYEGKNEQSYRVLRELEDELDTWKSNLAPHLRMEFTNGSPATNAIHSRAPLLVLSYHYARILIHRSVIGSGQSNESASVLAIADSSKCITQIIQLLHERKLGFTFCLNRNQLLVLSGLSVLYSSLDYSQGGGLVKDSQRVIRTVLDELERESCTAAKQFRLIAAALSPMEFQQQCPSISSPETQDFPASPSSLASTAESHDEPCYRSMSGLPTSPSLPPHLLTQPSRSVPDAMNSPNSNIKRSRTLGSPSQLKSRHNRTQSLHTRNSSASLTDLHQDPYQAKYSNPNMSSPDLFLHTLPQTTSSPWPLDGGMPLSQTDDWEQLLSLMDSSHAAHIYGEFVPTNGAGVIESQQAAGWVAGELDMLGQKGFIHDFDQVGSAGTLSTNGSDVAGDFRRATDLGWDV